MSQGPITVYRPPGRRTQTGPVVIYAAHEYWYVRQVPGGWTQRERYRLSAVWLDDQHRLPADEAACVLALVGAPTPEAA